MAAAVGDEQRYQVGRDVVQERVGHVQVRPHALTVGWKRISDGVKVQQLRRALQVVQRLGRGDIVSVCASGLSCNFTRYGNAPDPGTAATACAAP